MQTIFLVTKVTSICGKLNAIHFPSRDTIGEYKGYKGYKESWTWKQNIYTYVSALSLPQWCALGESLNFTRNHFPPLKNGEWESPTVHFIFTTFNDPMAFGFPRDSHVEMLKLSVCSYR